MDRRHYIMEAGFCH